MLNIKKTTSLAMSLAMLVCITGCDNETAQTTVTQQSPTAIMSSTSITESISPVETTTSAETVPITTISTLNTREASADIALTTTAVSTSEFVSDIVSTEEEIVTTTELEMPTSINESIIMLVAENLENAESFIMDCRIMGCVPSGSSIPDLMEHSYSYEVVGDKAHLRSEYQDLNKNITPLVYEEYQFREERILTTITRNGNGWVDNTVKKMSRETIVDNAIDSIGLLRFFDTEYTFREEDSINTAEIITDENGNYIITMPAWKSWITADATLSENAFAGLLRYPEKTFNLHDIRFNECEDGNVVYTIDKNYNLTNITADIYTNDTGYDLHVEIEFSNWNKTSPFSIPHYETIPVNAELAE